MIRKNKHLVHHLVLVLVLVFSVLVPQAVVAHASEKNTQEFEPLTTTDIQSLLPFMNAVQDIPDELLESGTSQDINNFMNSHGVDTHIYNDYIGETVEVLHLRSKRADGWRCALAIGQIIVTVGIPATKITKIKKYIAALGGVKQAAALLVGATSISEKANGILTSLGTILMSITGIDGIKKYCFS